MKKITHQQIVNETSNGVIVTDKTGIITHFNKRAAYILETEIKNVLGKRIMDVFAISGRHIMKCLKMQKSETGIAVTGNKVDLVLNITLVKEKDILLGAICNFQEIKFFENIGKKLEFYQKLNKQLNTIFHSSSDGIWVLDSKGLVIDINKAAEKADGIVAKQVIGKNVTQLLEAGIVDRVVTPDVIKCKKQVTVISRNQKSKKTLLVTGTPALDEKGNISLIIVNQRDMSQLDSLREELEHSQMITEKIKDELTEITYQKLKK